MRDINTFKHNSQKNGLQTAAPPKNWPGNMLNLEARAAAPRQKHILLEPVTKLSHAGASIKKSRTWCATCLRPGLRQVGDLISDKIDLMEFGH